MQAVGLVFLSSLRSRSETWAFNVFKIDPYLFYILFLCLLRLVRLLYGRLERLLVVHLLGDEVVRGLFKFPPHSLPMLHMRRRLLVGFQSEGVQRDSQISEHVRRQQW